MTLFNDEISRKFLIDDDDRAQVRNDEATHVQRATDISSRDIHLAPSGRPSYSP